MAMEKRGQTTEKDICKLVKQADELGRVVVINMDGFARYAETGRHKEGVVIIATGPRAASLREVLRDILT